MTAAWSRVRRLIGEAVASARSAPAVTLITAVICAGMVFVLMLTSGRTVGAQDQIRATLDSQGTRSLTVRVGDAAGLSSDVLRRLDLVSGVSWVGVFGKTEDTRNSRVPGGTPVPVQEVHTSDFASLGLPETLPLPGASAYVSPGAARQLGLPPDGGGVRLESGRDLSVAGTFAPPDFLEHLDPVVLVPFAADAPPRPIGSIIVIAESPALVGAVGQAVLSVLAPKDPSALTLQTSKSLADLRTLIDTQLSAFSRGLVIGMLVLSALLTIVLLSALVILRRKDFGRRRALGASRGFIIALLTTQTAITATAGAAIGLVASTVTLLALGDPLPSPRFLAALALLAAATATGASVLPAILASRRQPAIELRVA